MLNKFINNQENHYTIIGTFKIYGKYIYHGKDICNSLFEQYNNQFSSWENDEKNLSIFFYTKGDLYNINVNKDDTLAALGKLDSSSTAGLDGVPSTLLTKTKEISVPLLIILKKSR